MALELLVVVVAIIAAGLVLWVAATASFDWVSDRLLPVGFGLFVGGLLFAAGGLLYSTGAPPDYDCGTFLRPIEHPSTLELDAECDDQRQTALVATMAVAVVGGLLAGAARQSQLDRGETHSPRQERLARITPPPPAPSPTQARQIQTPQPSPRTTASTRSETPTPSTPSRSLGRPVEHGSWTGRIRYQSGSGTPAQVVESATLTRVDIDTADGASVVPAVRLAMPSIGYEETIRLRDFDYWRTHYFNLGGEWEYAFVWGGSAPSNAEEGLHVGLIKPYSPEEWRHFLSFFSALDEAIADAVQEAEFDEQWQKAWDDDDA